MPEELGEEFCSRYVQGDILFFYRITTNKLGNTYFVYFRYGSVKDGEEVIFGDEMQTFDSFEKMKEEKEKLRNYVKGLGHQDG